MCDVGRIFHLKSVIFPLGGGSFEYHPKTSNIRHHKCPRRHRFDTEIEQELDTMGVSTKFQCVARFMPK